MRCVLAILIVVVVLAGPGCESLRRNIPTFGNKYRVENFFVDREGLMKVSRVVVLPFANCSDYSDAPVEVADMFALELRKLRKFDVVVVDEISGVSAISAYPNGGERMQEVRSVCRAYNANAVLLGEIKSYEPYRPFVLGLRITMLSGETGRTVWAVDETLDSSMERVANTAKEYYRREMDKGVSEMNAQLITTSMREYTKFVAYSLASTL